MEPKSLANWMWRVATGKSARCRAIALECERVAECEFLLRATYSLESATSAGFDWACLVGGHSPLRAESISVPPRFKRAAGLWGTTRPIGPLGLYAERGVRVHEADVRVDYRWLPGKWWNDDPGNQALVLPDALFFLRSWQASSSLEWTCPIAHASISPDTGLSVAGIDASLGEPSGSYLQLVLSNTSSSISSGGPSISVSRRFSDEVDPWHRSQVLAMAEGILSSAADWYGVRFPGTVLIALVSELEPTNTFRSGAVAAVDPRKMFAGGQITPYAYVSLGLHLVGAWWGIGCRLVGPRHREMRDGIGLALLLRWLEVNQPEIRDHLIQRMGRAPGLRAPPWTGKKIDAPAAYRIALDVWPNLSRGEVQESVRTLLRTRWGSQVEAAELAALLGVSLPKSGWRAGKVARQSRLATSTLEA